MALHTLDSDMTVAASRPAMGEARSRLRLGRLMPRTLFGRALVIIVTPLLIVQAAATWYFYDRHWDIMSKRLSEGIAGEIALTLDEMQRLTGDAERAALFARMRRFTRLDYRFERAAVLGEQPDFWGYDILDFRLRQQLQMRTGAAAIEIDPTTTPDRVEIAVQLPDGVLRVSAPLTRLSSESSTVFILVMVGSSILLFTVALVFMRNQIRPIRRLANAAEQFGKGRDVSHFRLEGAAEVRQAARAFLLMRERIQRQIGQRTDMLSGVSHDLRTPLTRMKLQLAMLGDSPEVDELKSDVAEMERMIEGYLAFARGEGQEVAAPTDLTRLLQDVVNSARRGGATVDLAVPDGIVLPLRPQAIRRCIANLLSNARRHGRQIWVSAGWQDDSHVEVLVEDDGPGIPEHELENVFRPFYRLDRSRNEATGGSGLGLTIARDIARRHGGDLRLSRSPHRGLRTTISLPA